MSEDENNCQIDDNCSKGTCAPVSPFSKDGSLFLIFIFVLLAILFFALNLYGYI